MIKNNQNKFLYLTILILLFGLISGCSSDDREIVVVDIHSGNGKVEIEFIENLPPSKAYASEELQIGFKAINYGAYEVKNGIISLVGDPGYLFFEDGLTSEEEITDLTAKSNYDPRDTEQFFIFDAKTAFPDKGFSEHESVLYVNYCYDYENVFNDQICVDPDQYNLKPVDNKVCQVSESSYSGQGGPVGISSITPKMILRDDDIYPQFRIHIRNFGTGQIFSTGQSDIFCGSESINRDFMNSIKIDKIEFSDMTLEDFDCFPDINDVVIRDREADIICTLKEGSSKRLRSIDEAYTTNLNIEFKYGYSESVSKTITLINQNDMIR
ncbi:hypothetical protein C0585_06255 [Candidatus Woesearchaeota archaeon]|nr:MAG: hypothetical protein C0585_06255 [Candidatus Woesearchaeota archaeon]